MYEAFRFIRDHNFISLKVAVQPYQQAFLLEV